MGALLGQTHAFPFIPHMDREHILTAEPRDVLVAVRIQRLLLTDGGATPAGVNGDT